MEAGAPYLYPEQDSKESKDWKETVIDKFTKLQMEESLDMVAKKHRCNRNATNEMKESFKQHLTHALWIAVEVNDLDLINTLTSINEGPLWINTPENMEKFEKFFNDDAQVDRLACLVATGAPYLYPEQDQYPREDWKETVIDKFTKLQMEESLEMVFRVHRCNDEVTEESDNKYKQHIGHTLGIAAETNNINLINILVNEDPIDVDVFRIAACDGGWKTLQKVPKDLEQKNYDGFTMLHLAAQAGRGTTVKYLLEQGADPNSHDRHLCTPLMLAGAAETKDELTLSLLIENSDITRETVGGLTILHLIVRDGLYKYVPRLIELGSDPTGKQNYFHLIDAAKGGHTLTVKALLNGGAILSQSDLHSKTALDYSLANKNDATSALLIRMDPTLDDMDFFMKRYSQKITLDELVKSKQKETITALLDRSVFETYKRDFIHVKMVHWENGDFLEGLAKWGDDELAHHGTIRKLVDFKMSRFGYFILSLRMVIYLIFMLALSYSIIQASTVGIPRDTYTQGPLNNFRIVTDLFVLFFFLTNIITEVVEVFRIMRNTHEYLKNKGDQKKKDRKWRGKLYNIFCIRVTVDYLRDLSNWFDMLALLTLFILIILRVAAQPVEWVFATLTFFLNAARLFKYIVLIPKLGPYSTIIFKILIHDVPLFSTLFLITLFIFTGGYFISLRTSYSSEGFSNASLAQDTVRMLGVDNGVQWVFLSGLRILLEGSVYQDEYVYSHLNWLAVCIYFAFLFLTVVVFLNVFIAQLSDRYAIVKERANQIYALQKLNFVVQVERTSVFSACIDFKKYGIMETQFTRDVMLEYYNYSDPVTMNDDAINAVKGTKQYTKYPKIKDDKVEPEVAKSDERIDLLCEKVERLENILLAIEGKLT